MYRNLTKRAIAAAAIVVAIAVTDFGVADAHGAVGMRNSMPSLAGSYVASIYTKHGFIVPTGPLTLTRAGHFSFALSGGGNKGTWTETSGLVTLTATGNDSSGAVYTVRARGVDLGSASHPGRVTDNGHSAGKWYATRPSVSTLTWTVPH